MDARVERLDAAAKDLGEARGKQELFTRQSPQKLKALREHALIESAVSSNRIEGVTVEADRLRPLVLGKARPKDRPEHEILGYRRALNEVHTQADTLVISADTVRRFHKLCQEGSGDAGQFKKVDNEIVELRPDGPPVIRFKCVKAKDTPAAVDELCLLYRHALDQENVPPLVALCALVFDFLCIHPFRDGNGRVSRLLTLLALYQHGYEVGRYISILGDLSGPKIRIDRFRDGKVDLAEGATFTLDVALDPAAGTTSLQAFSETSQ